MRRFLAFAFLTIAACGASAAPAHPLAAPSAIRAGTSGTYPPLSDWYGDRPDGFAPAILDAFAASQHQRVAWSRFAWPGLSADMQAGAFDLAADGITVRADRSMAGRFSVPIARRGAVLLMHSSAYGNVAISAAAPRQVVEAIRRPGLRVVVNAGGYLEGVARRFLSGSDIRAIPDNSAVRDAFVRGDADVAMTNTFEASRWQTGLLVVEAVGPLTSDVTALWIRADQTALAEALDAWLLEEEASGRLERLREKWLGSGGGGPAARPVDALIAATAERLALMPLLVASCGRREAGRASSKLRRRRACLPRSGRRGCRACRERLRNCPAKPRARRRVLPRADRCRQVRSGARRDPRGGARTSVARQGAPPGNRADHGAYGLPPRPRPAWRVARRRGDARAR